MSASMVAGDSVRGSPGHADFDRQFIDLLASHHRDSIAMLELATNRSEHSELRGFASEGIPSRTADVATLRDWRAKWYGHGEIPPSAARIQLPDMPEHVVVPIALEIERLKSAKPFDKGFIEVLLPHHQVAIDAAKVASLRATHGEVKALAKTTVERHEKEVDQLKAWYTRWYGATRH
jgi:uncharacterized protein (DUF305 family)